MSRSTHTLGDDLRDYVRDHALTREHPVLARLREHTATLPMARMQISPEQGQLMALLVRTMGAKRCLEVGTFTGYSALAVALALPDDGHLLACDVSEDWTDIARRHWVEAGVEDRIELVLGPAADTLATRIEAGAAGTFDLAFIDADKTGYDVYYERSLVLLRAGGIIALDNAFMGGDVVAPNGPSSEAIRALNDKIAGDDRVDPALVPIGDGLLLARKR